MNLPVITQSVSLAIFVVIAYFQIRNFLRYKKTNGANTVRIVLFLMNACFIAHNVRLLLGINHGYFFSSMAVLWFFLYWYSLHKKET